MTGPRTAEQNNRRGAPFIIIFLLYRSLQLQIGGVVILTVNISCHLDTVLECSLYVQKYKYRILLYIPLRGIKVA